MAALEVQNLTMRFGGITAVNGVSLAVAPGQIYSVIGPNGAGKTTVFNAITGIYQPTAGHVLFEGHRVSRPFTWKVVASAVAIGLAVAVLFALAAVNADLLWKAAIRDNAGGAKADFPTAKVIDDAARYIGERRDNASLAALVGFALGTAGSIVVWNRDRRAPDVVCRGGIARTFQNIRLFHAMTVLENVMVGWHDGIQREIVPWTRAWFVYSWPGFLLTCFVTSPLGWLVLRAFTPHPGEQRAPKKAAELLKFVGLAGKHNELAKNLPYGDQRRLEIARALATEPRLLLLDEPAAGMNPSETVNLMELIRKIRDCGVTVLLIEHHMNLVMGISDRVAVLDYGVKIAEGPPLEVSRDPKVIEAYLGKEEVS